MSGLEFQICVHVPETAETVFTQHAAFTHITIKSAVQAAGNGINPPLLGCLRVPDLALLYARELAKRRSDVLL